MPHQALSKLQRRVTQLQGVAAGTAAGGLHTAEEGATVVAGATVVVARMGEAAADRVDLAAAATNAGRRGTGPGTAPMLEGAGSEGAHVWPQPPAKYRLSPKMTMGLQLHSLAAGYLCYTMRFLLCLKGSFLLSKTEKKLADVCHFRAVDKWISNWLFSILPHHPEVNKVLEI